MFLYNVTIKVDNDIHDDFIEWMRKQHLPAVMSTGMFTHYRMSRLLGLDEPDGTTYTVQYLCDSMQKYERYVEEFAPHLRQQTFSRYGDKVVAFRTLMQVLE